MHGRMLYTTTLANTPTMSPLTKQDVFAMVNVFSQTLNVGDTQDVYIYWGYKNLDPYYADKRNVSQSAAGVVEITNFLSTTGFKFGIANVLWDRTGQVNEYSVLNFLNQELMNGATVQWYPDADAFPSEYYSCVANKRLDQKRQGVLPYYTFDFDLMVLASVQVPSTVPAFALA